MRLAKPSDCILKISSQRSVRAVSSAGTNGVGEKYRVSGTSFTGSEKGMISYPSVTGSKLVLRQRSERSLPRSSSVQAQPSANGRDSESSAPFSAIRLCPEKTMSVVDSPWPASA